ncbi:hypothetical protein OJ998_02175 [Solirubrobacter taibaiensis]|nr:hypothetical protein [Solirubrobacter taibaiensis]
MHEPRSCYALRRQEHASADAWWREASKRRDLPAALVPLAAGRGRVELDRQEAADALDWAESVSEDGRPIVAYPDDPRVELTPPATSGLTSVSVRRSV